MIKTQQLPLEEQQHIRHSLSVTCEFDLGAASTCVLVHQSWQWWPGRQVVACGTGSSGDSQHHPVLLGCSGSPESYVDCLSQVPGWGKEQHPKCCFALPFKAHLSSTWSLPVPIMWLCWGRGGSVQRNPIFFQDLKKKTHTDTVVWLWLPCKTDGKRINGNAGPAAGQCVCPPTSPVLVWESSTLSMVVVGLGMTVSLNPGLSEVPNSS